MNVVSNICWNGSKVKIIFFKHMFVAYMWGLKDKVAYQCQIERLIASKKHDNYSIVKPRIASDIIVNGVPRSNVIGTSSCAYD